jgi:preprotein translocase subunit SecD
MRSPKRFTLIIFITSIVLLFFVIPLSFSIKNIQIPFFKDKQALTVNSEKINFQLGPIKFEKEFSYRLGLDLQGGTQLIYEVDMTDIKKEDRDSAFESAREIIDKRINFFGVTEPTIQSLKLPDEYRIIIELPGATDLASALDLIGKTAQLTFWEGGEIKSGEVIATPPAGMYPFGLSELYNNKPVKTGLTGKDLKKASVIFGSQDGTPQVQIDFTPEGSKYFADITTRNVGRQVAIVLDQLPVSAPVVQQPILNGNAVISGNFTTDTAKNLAIQLNAGALPAPLEIVGQKTVPASLGIESLKKSMLGGILGFLSVIIFMVFLYRKEGILASVALVVYIILTLFIFKAIPVTLTLAGIAGFILSIGMAVDANILIFERMHEELRAGKSRSIAVKLGFARAWSSIRDSNVSSLITCAILFQFGSGSIRGFALTLAIGILVSMFSAIVVTKNLLAIFEKDKI